MAEKLRKRPSKITKPEDLNPDQLERIHQHYDDRIRELDNRRISQGTVLEDGASLADVITALNLLLSQLNNSDLTEG